MNFLTKLDEIPTNKNKAAVFIDDANYFHIQPLVGWKVSTKKLKAFLEEHFEVVGFNYYLGLPKLPKTSLEPSIEEIEEVEKINKSIRFNLAAKRSLGKMGCRVVMKSVKKIITDRATKEFEYKCNFDVEIALDVTEQIENADYIIIGSGDSDFVAIKNYCLKKDKKFIALCFKELVAWEIRRCWHIFLEDIKSEIEYIP